MILPGLRCWRCDKNSGVTYLHKCFVYPDQIYICKQCDAGLAPNWRQFMLAMVLTLALFLFLSLVMQFHFLPAWAMASAVFFLLWLPSPFLEP